MIVPNFSTASEQLCRMRSGEVTAEQLVSDAIGQAEHLSYLKAFLAIDAEYALSRARSIDRAKREGTVLPALAGLPICVKDNIDMAGWVTSGATPALAKMRPRRSAPVLQRLVDAGAIVLGKTNLHELAFGITNTNFGPDFAPACNPHDTQRITGGSSGGSAAAIAAGIVNAGLGTDTSGSIRIPAAFCGIAGLRPSVGNGGNDRRYPLEGILPISHTNDTAGPMARTVVDVALLDAVITGEPIGETISLRGLRLGMPNCFWTELDPGIETVCRDFCRELRDRGSVLVELPLPGLRSAWKGVSAPVVLHEALHDIPEYLRTNGWEELSLPNLYQQIANPDVRAAFEAVLANNQDEDYRQAMSVYRPALCQIYRDAFRDHELDALIFPTVPISAPLINMETAFGEVEVGKAGIFRTFDTCIRNTDPGANAGLPGLSMPVGMTKEGLPVGIELDGWVGSDRHLLAIGIAMEQALLLEDPARHAPPISRLFGS